MPMIVHITDFLSMELDVYTRLKEPQLQHYYEPVPGLFIAESPKVIERALNAGYLPVSALMDQNGDSQDQKLISRLGDIPIYTAPSEVLKKITGFSLTRGMLCAMRRHSLPSVEEICSGARRIAVLEQVVNPTNVGAIFRSAAALNLDGVLLTKGCSDPLYRRSARVSMGTVFQIPWTYLSDHPVLGKDGNELLHRLGLRTAAMALWDHSLDIDDPRVGSEKRLAIILGTEGEGLCQETIRACDYTVRIPMKPGVDSLNVAAASAVAFWQLGNRK
ncbi:MAG: RNA methyltransferase [Clostridiales bacterium]|nr:RNA methyltransferase [Clostridiales bacterium]